MFEAFNRHPRDVGETYGEHLAQASGFGASLVTAGLACLVHAVFPFWFERTASRRVQDLHARMSRRRAMEPVAGEVIQA